MNVLRYIKIGFVALTVFLGLNNYRLSNKVDYLDNRLAETKHALHYYEGKLNDAGKIVSLMDNDRTGKQESIWLRDNYDIIPILIPKEIGAKDFAELVSKNNIETGMQTEICIPVFCLNGFPLGGSCQRPCPLTDEGKPCHYGPAAGCRRKSAPLRGSASTPDSSLSSDPYFFPPAQPARQKSGWPLCRRTPPSGRR